MDSGKGQRGMSGGPSGATLTRRPRRCIALLIMIVVGWISPWRFSQSAEPRAREPRKPQVPVLKLEKYTPKNGLTVILHEDYKTPLVAINSIVGDFQSDPAKRWIEKYFGRLRRGVENVELINEMVDLTGEEAISEEEIAAMECNTVPQTFASFETTTGIAGQIFHLIANNLGDNLYGTRVDHVEPVTAEDVGRVAKQYFKPDLMTILVVGDRTKIEGPLKSLPFVKNICLLDADGEAIPDPLVDKQGPASK